MGWANGSNIAGVLIASAKLHIQSGEERKAFYRDMIDAFEEADCDTLGECCGDDDMFDEAMQELHPDYFEDEDEEEYDPEDDEGEEEDDKTALNEYHPYP